MEPGEINLRHLRAVAAIAACGSVSAAAESVSLSQPALTQGLARLEAQTGTALFVRRPDGMTPTAAGTLLAARADEAAAQIARAMQPARRGGRGGFARPERLLTAAQVRALLALADAGSFAGAASATGISPPSLHRATRDVERLAGTLLVERRGRGVALTEAGRRVARGFRLATAAIRAGLEEVAALGGPDPGTIVIGAMPLARARLLPEALAELLRRHPAAAVTVIEGSYRELVEPLRDGRIDLMVGALREAGADADLVQRPLFEDRLAVIARADHPLATGVAADLAALARYPWIVGLPGAPVRTLWERMFGDARPRAPVDCGSVMIMRGLLLASDLLTLLSRDQVGVELGSGLLTTIRTTLPAASRTIGLTHRAGWRPAAIGATMLALLEEAGTRLAETQ